MPLFYLFFSRKAELKAGGEDPIDAEEVVTNGVAGAAGVATTEEYEYENEGNEGVTGGAAGAATTEEYEYENEGNEGVTGAAGVATTEEYEYEENEVESEDATSPAPVPAAVNGRRRRQVPGFFNPADCPPGLTLDQCEDAFGEFGTAGLPGQPMTGQFQPNNPLQNPNCPPGLTLDQCEDLLDSFPFGFPNAGVPPVANGPTTPFPQPAPGNPMPNNPLQNCPPGLTLDQCEDLLDSFPFGFPNAGGPGVPPVANGPTTPFPQPAPVNPMPNNPFQNCPPGLTLDQCEDLLDSFPFGFPNAGGPGAPPDRKSVV